MCCSHHHRHAVDVSSHLMISYLGTSWWIHPPYRSDRPSPEDGYMLLPMLRCRTIPLLISNWSPVITFTFSPRWNMHRMISILSCHSGSNSDRRPMNYHGVLVLSFSQGPVGTICLESKSRSRHSYRSAHGSFSRHSCSSGTVDDLLRVHIIFLSNLFFIT